MHGDTWTVGNESLYVLAGRLPDMCLRVHTVTVGVTHCLASRCLPGHVQPIIIGQPHMVPRASRAPFQVMLQVSTRTLQYGRAPCISRTCLQKTATHCHHTARTVKHVLHCCHTNNLHHLHPSSSSCRP